MIAFDIESPDYAKGNGTIPVVVQDAIDGRVRMVAYADREALEATVRTGVMHFRSRTRGLWHKGSTSGHELIVRSLHLDCDRDAMLAIVEPIGPTCHTGDESCFPSSASSILPSLSAVLRERVAALADGRGANGSYTTRLLSDPNLRLKKLGEETAELVAALATQDRERATAETADLLYHAFVALTALGIAPRDVLTILDARNRSSAPATAGM